MRAAVAALFCWWADVDYEHPERGRGVSFGLYPLPKRGGDFGGGRGSRDCRFLLLGRAKLGPIHGRKGLRCGSSSGFRSRLAALRFNLFVRGDWDSLCVSLGVIRLLLPDNVRGRFFLLYAIA